MRSKCKKILWHGLSSNVSFQNKLLEFFLKKSFTKENMQTYLGKHKTQLVQRKSLFCDSRVDTCTEIKIFALNENQVFSKF